ncbi:MAG: tRNA glutamyl-Q(34) synthetase GluQRS [Gammaproteobacteria bacterium]|nr:tRNA glutamyl-Q(34) synthetase GluQRS [Gammaproteobacteria bacterium]
MTYVGRFAPSPTGPLHFGSLIAAVGSCLRARSVGGRWLVRMEDIDPPREQPGAADAILATLIRYGFEWDGEVMYQSARGDAYDAALAGLRERGLLFPCTCTRRDIADAGGVYPGTCRDGLPAGHDADRTPAFRVRSDGPVVRFRDLIQGDIEEHVETAVGDFVLRRADGLYAYQLAVVVDDAEQGVTEVVRGSDLLDSTARQIHLQRLLGVPTPAYLHLPIAVDANGDKLSKQTFAPALPDHDPVFWLVWVLAFLGQKPPDGLSGASLPEFWDWAIANWRVELVPRKRAIPMADVTQGEV